MSNFRTLIALLKPEMYRWRHLFYVTGVVWVFVAASELVGGMWLRAVLAFAIAAAYFCFYEKCRTWKAQS